VRARPRQRPRRQGYDRAANRAHLRRREIRPRIAWQTEILAWHRTAGCSNGPTEAINLLIKKVKRVGHGFRNFANYRLRLLLHCGVRWQTHRTARLRSRVLGLVA
jgi:transposase